MEELIVSWIKMQINIQIFIEEQFLVEEAYETCKYDTHFTRFVERYKIV